ncbi:PilW family protein [Porticoccaceae bacterium LTM1]|nr:PilW family protein [Porticoccaceae bacterium LTM1]
MIHFAPKNCKGFSLVELMVALVLGLLLSAGIINIYIDSRRNFNFEEEAARLQENGRYAINLLKSNLTQAGFFGGMTNKLASAQSVTKDCVAGVNWVLDGTEPIDLINDYSSSTATVRGKTLNCLTTGTLQADSDIVTVKRTAGDMTIKSGAAHAGASGDATQWYLHVEKSNSSWHYGTGFSTSSLSNYWEYYAKVFYVRDYSLTAGDDVPTLCAEQLEGDEMTTSALVEGIENMQIEFGIDTDNDGVSNRFETAPDASEIQDAIMARIYLLVRSVNEAPVGYTDDKSYTLGSKVIAAKNDRYLRKVFSTSVQLRNAGIPRI